MQLLDCLELPRPKDGTLYKLREMWDAFNNNKFNLGEKVCRWIKMHLIKKLIVNTDGIDLLVPLCLRQAMKVVNVPKDVFENE